jgi:hypothetical protein
MMRACSLVVNYPAAMERTVNLPKPAGDHALKGILATNLIVLALAVWQDWSVLQLMWPFWMQSVIIGWYARQRMLERDPQRRVANFFAAHFGIFHAVYLVFLIGFSTSTDAAGFMEVAVGGTETQVYIGHVHPADFVAYLVLALAFWRSHRASHLEHLTADLGRAPSLGTLMMLPYARILPMHLTLIAAMPLGGADAVWLFVLLKIVADLVMHKVEHWLLRQVSASACSNR